MAFSLEKEMKWQRFLAAAAVVWETNDLGRPEWVLMHQIIGLSDWGMTVPHSDQMNPRRMVVHAQNAMARSMGYRSADARFSM